MAITNFIPSVWSETLYTQLDKKYIAAAHCNRDFEGDIKEIGSVVKICGVEGVNIGTYTKNSDMGAPQELTDTVRELAIDQAKYFNFQIDDIDRAQATPKLMEAAMRVAASGLANEADKYIYKLILHAKKSMFVELETGEIIDKLIEARTLLYRENVSDSNEVIIEVSPQVARAMLKEKIAMNCDSGEALESGCIGSIAGCKVFVSNNIYNNESLGDDAYYHMCVMRTKRAIAFAEQLSEVEAYRPESRFADAVKGLYLFGAKAVYPEEMVCLEFRVPFEY